MILSMTAGTLIEALQQFEPDTPVLLASDAEGNEFHVLGEAALDVGMGFAQEVGTPWIVERLAFDEDETFEPVAEEYQAIVLWPV